MKKNNEPPKIGVVAFDGKRVFSKTINTKPDEIAERIAKVVHSFYARYYFKPTAVILGLLDYMDLLGFFHEQKTYPSDRITHYLEFMGLQIIVSGALRGITVAIPPDQAIRLAPGIIRQMENAE